MKRASSAARAARGRPPDPRPILGETVCVRDGQGEWKVVDVREQRMRRELAHLLVEAHRREIEARSDAEPQRAARARNLAAAREAWLATVADSDTELRARAERLQRMESLSNTAIANRLGCSRRKVAKLFGHPWRR